MIYVTGQQPAVPMAKIVADEWCKDMSEDLDIWSYDYFGQEFVEAFLKECQNQGHLKKASEVMRRAILTMHIAPCLQEECDYYLSEANDWIDNFLKSEVENV